MILRESAFVGNKMNILQRFCTLLVITLWTQSLFAADGGKLPRSFGGISLGMSEQTFEMKFRLATSGCATCQADEHYSSFFLDKDEAHFFNKEPINNKDLQTGYLTYLPASLKPKDVHCYFYKGKLYAITFSHIQSTLETIRDSYVKKLGKPTIDVWDTGVSQMRWQNASTRLSVVYQTGTKGSDVFDISYADLNIMETMPDDETE